MIHIGATWRTGIVQAHTADDEPEWPVHPERLAEALLSCAHAREDGAPLRAALRALEGTAPTVRLTRYADARGGFVMDRYARNVRTDANKLLVAEVFFRHNPIVVYGDGPHAVYSYDLPEDSERDVRLAELLSEVWYLGKSLSSVTLRLLPEAPANMRVLVPDEKVGKYRMRVPEVGRLALLESSYADRTAGVAAATQTSGTLITKKVKNEPEAADNRDTKNAEIAYLQMREFRDAETLVKQQRYRESREVAASPFVLDVSMLETPDVSFTGQNFGVAITAYRTAWLNQNRSQDPRLTGHEASKAPTLEEHVGFVPILDVDRPYSSGKLLGFGVLIPRSLPEALAQEAREATSTVKTIQTVGGRISIFHETEIELQQRKEQGSSRDRLRLAKRMRETSKTWATVTPAMTWRHIKPQHLRRDPNTMLPAIEEMFERAGLPIPIRIDFRPVSAIPGAPHAAQVERDAKMIGLPVLRHFSFTFAEDVSGPIVLGRRAWKGYGICLPTN